MTIASVCTTSTTSPTDLTDQNRKAEGSPSKAPGRQERKSAATRARILEALIECVERDGFQGATSSRIALRAGVSVGAVQHQFASKDDLLDALLEMSADRFAASFDGHPPDGHGEPAPGRPDLSANPVIPVESDLAERIASFVDRAWVHYGSSFFRAAQEVMLATRNRTGGRRSLALKRSAEIAEKIWIRHFGDIRLAREQQREIRRFAFSTLTGLAMMARFESDPGRLEPELNRLKQALGSQLDQRPPNAR
jgi:AcrR family transcriptional regulator